MKKIFALLLVPVAALLLSGCGKQEKTPAAPSIGQPEQQTTQDSATAPLPQNPAAAIDSEISNIDKEIDSATEEIDSAELSDTQFGL